MSSMTFQIDDRSTVLGAQVPVIVTITENAGKLDFTVSLGAAGDPNDVLGDLRGLWFQVQQDLVNQLKVSGLTWVDAGSAVTTPTLDTTLDKHDTGYFVMQGDNSVDTLQVGSGNNTLGNNSNNLQGGFASLVNPIDVVHLGGFDVGISLGAEGTGGDKAEIREFSFSLGSDLRALTINDVAGMDFAARVMSTDQNVGLAGSYKLLEHTSAHFMGEAVDDQVCITEQSTATGNVLDNDSQVAGSNLSVTAGAGTYAIDLTGGLSASLTLGGDGSYTVTAGDETDALGRNEHYELSVGYTATDNWTDPNDATSHASSSDSATLAVCVDGVNDTPLAADDDLGTVSQGQFGYNNGQVSLAYNVIAGSFEGGTDSDVDRGDVLQVAAVEGVTDGDDGLVDGVIHVTLASGATVEMNVNGDVVYNPNGITTDLDNGQFLNDSFSYTLTDATLNGDESLNFDGSLDANANVTIHVTGMNDPEDNTDTGNGGKGLSHGYWKNHTGVWGDVAGTTTSYETFFGVNNGDWIVGKVKSAPTMSDDVNFLQALKLPDFGSAQNTLARDAVAAVLNAYSTSLTTTTTDDYAYTVDEIVDKVQDAYAAGNDAALLALATELNALNSL